MRREIEENKRRQEKDEKKKLKQLENRANGDIHDWKEYQGEKRG